MKKILILSAHPPLKHSKEAGQKVFYDFLENISRNNNVYLISFVRKEEYNWGFDDSFKLCEQIETVEFNTIQKAATVLMNAKESPIFNARNSKEFKYKLKRMLENHTFDAVHFEWEQMIQYYDYVKNIPLKTVTCHDVISQMYTRKTENSSFLRRVYKYYSNKIIQNESHILSKMNNVFTLNSKDSNLLKIINKDIITNEITPYYNKCKPSPSNLEKKYDLVFFGALNRMENEKGILWFLDKVYPKIIEKKPGVSLQIIGNKPSKRLINYSKEQNITVTGFVEDPYELILKTKIGIVPLFLGAGIKIKTLEFMSCGIPVVTTEVGIEGIPASKDEGVFVENHVDDFVRTILYLLDNEAEAKELGLKAREFVGKEFDYENNTEKLDEIYSN